MVRSSSKPDPPSRPVLFAVGTFVLGADSFVLAGSLPAAAHDLHLSVAQAGRLTTTSAPHLCDRVAADRGRHGPARPVPGARWRDDGNELSFHPEEDKEQIRMSTHETVRFTHQVTSAGPAQGMTFTGRRRLAESNEDVPLVVAVHGGGYTSAYFDVPGYSLLDRAAVLGVPIIAVDRPGHGGSSSVPANGSVFLAHAEALEHLIGELWQTHGAGTAGVVLIGHSIGVPISLAVAAHRPKWPLLGVAASGCLLREPEHFTGIWASIPDLTLRSPDDRKAELMFGPARTRRDDMPEAAYFANEPVVKAELVEISSSWHSLFQDLAPEISVPVHLRIGEYDALWIADDEQIAAFAAALTSSPSVDAAFFPAAGHAIDYHRAGAAFQTQQLAFALHCVARRLSETH
ncbi:alpha/beta fold hydrolase [Streptomyces sp. S465]|uniref:alpha/beta fold hydrolase n=1 Tax=Streptomyces sp. S465 TaxID=2979468 RepID=UPI0022A88635|nr:alpha/beta fold hydrolase [Streptomyces sp. S465]WAP53511.1 alpha/beta fold hydrolase [Streptomyces sp. S465]